MESRRAFLRRITAVPLACAIGVSAPTMAACVRQRVSSLSLDDINAIALRTVWPGIIESFFQPHPLLALLRQPGTTLKLSGGTSLQCPLIYATRTTVTERDK